MKKIRIQVKDVVVGYDKKIIVNGLTIRIPDGKITTIIGSNGCGKSTLLKAMTRIIPHQEGQVLLDGTEIQKKPTKELARELAILPQTQDSAVGLTVEELVSYGRFPHQTGFGNLTKEDRRIMEWAMKATNTLDFQYSFVDELSGGQKQRTSAARALVGNPSIVFADEPTGALDSKSATALLSNLEKINKEKKVTIMMVTHDSVAASFCTRVLFLKDGQIYSELYKGDKDRKQFFQEIMNTQGVLSGDGYDA